MSQPSNLDGLTPPPIDPVMGDAPRPLWSVMIPAYNCGKYLRKTLESVLAQDPGPEKMQIEVVDDCSTMDHAEPVVREVGQGRVTFYGKPKNEGANRNFNTCIQRSRGTLLHILHGDDWVSPGFYGLVERRFSANPEVSLVATRSFFVTEEGVITAVTPRLDDLETSSREVAHFFENNPLQTPGVVVRRSAYETLGGFRPALVHTGDIEMWARVISNLGGIVAPDVLANYRCFAANDTGRMARTGENVRDGARLYDLFAQLFPAFSPRMGRQRLAELALRQYHSFVKEKDAAAAAANLALWKHFATKRERFVEGAKTLVRAARKARAACQTNKQKNPAVRREFAS